MKDSIIELRDISYHHPGGEELLKGVNLQLGQGRVGLVGANGSGKTTLFNIVMGLSQPASGALLLDGARVESRDQWRQLRRHVGYLFQDADDQLFSPTVIEDVAFGPLNLGATPGEARQRAMTTLSGLGLDHLAHRVTHHLSGGEKKLVSLATILVMEPRLLLLDEPSNNLDPASRESLMAILKVIPLPYLLISHDFDFLQETCDIIYSLTGGGLEEGATAQLHSHAHIHLHGDRPHAHGHD
ncbi:MAG: ABC transporter ATP-binding protein [Thermodesulfobacteriota bacterium]